MVPISDEVSSSELSKEELGSGELDSTGLDGDSSGIEESVGLGPDVYSAEGGSPPTEYDPGVDVSPATGQVVVYKTDVIVVTLPTEHFVA
jgi:hypothetical protein